MREENAASKKRRFALLIRLVTAILLGIAFGLTMRAAGLSLPVRVSATFNALFKEFLDYSVPLLVLGYVTSGIAGLGKGTGRALGATILLSFVMLVVAGVVAFVCARLSLPHLLPAGDQLAQFETGEAANVAELFTLEFPPFMDGMSATLTAFILGAGISTTGHSGLCSAAAGLEKIVDLLVRRVIVPCLPFYVFGIFASLAFAGTVFHVISAFSGVIALIVVLQSVFLLIEYSLAGAVTGKNPFRLIENALPVYVAALGTQSSSASIPVSQECAVRNGVSPEMSSFLCPLCASSYLPGSMITLTVGAVAMLTLRNGVCPGFAEILPFILRLVLVVIVAPGVPGGAVAAAMGLFKTQFGFDLAMLGLLSAVDIAQDSFESACNASSDGAAAIFLEAILRLSDKKKRAARSVLD
ncbi:MAG: cation:dicarboxylase symporter family transporter [Pyramidobacter sp.]|nr:cation:dicarboxylase symporter family transporter [Pyramidobacter sp.]